MTSFPLSPTWELENYYIYGYLWELQLERAYCIVSFVSFVLFSRFFFGKNLFLQVVVTRTLVLLEGGVNKVYVQHTHGLMFTGQRTSRAIVQNGGS